MAMVIAIGIMAETFCIKGRRRTAMRYRVFRLIVVVFMLLVCSGLIFVFPADNIQIFLWGEVNDLSQTASVVVGIIGLFFIGGRFLELIEE